MSSFKIIIPTRYASTRLPGKALVEIAGKQLVQHVYEAACKSHARDIFIATDDERILKAANLFGAKVIMTSKHHDSGTDRLAEAIELLGDTDNSIIVNLQGDELGMHPVVINQVAEALIENTNVNMSTVCETIQESEQILDPNIVKVVMDEHNIALYFSRAPIPWDREASGEIQNQYFRHIGLYAYRKDFLIRYSKMEQCSLEKLECLEQLRALYYGEKIHVSIAKETTGMGIDTPEDLEKARRELQG